MKVENIWTIEDAKDYCEGLMNDFEAGVSNKEETLKFLGEYTVRMHKIFWINAKKKIIESIEDLK